MKKLIVITGASAGIGLETAKEFAKLGHPLLLLARRVEKLEALNLPNTMVRKVDVRDLESFTNAVREAEEKYGDADLLVNNAGLMQLGDVETQDIDEWNNMVDINMKGVFNGCRIVLKKMRANKTGTIINVSSVVGKKSLASMAVYCGTKFGVSGFSESLRQEVYQDDVRVISICPGAVVTELQSHTNDEKYKEFLKSLTEVEGAALQAIDVANIIVHAYCLPQSVSLRDVVIAPTRQII